MDKLNPSALKTAGKWFVGLDLAWAAVLATLQSLFLNQAGVAIGANGTATALAAGSSWFTAFAIGLFQGAIFLVFAGIFALIWSVAYTFCVKAVDATLKPTINKIFGAFVLADLAWALLQAVQGAAIVAGIGSAAAVHADGLVLTTMTALSFIVSFAMGLFSGTVILTLLGAFISVGLILYGTFIKKS
jgi:hypothetical protein